MSAPTRTVAWLLGAFAGTAFLLAVGGLFGVMVYVVGSHTNEIGIRIALGASPSRVLRGFIGQAATVLVIGVATGLLVTVATVRFVESQLYGIAATDLVTYATTGSAFLLVGILASFIPALRATRVDPLTALRAE